MLACLLLAACTTTGSPATPRGASLDIWVNAAIAYRADLESSDVGTLLQPMAISAEMRRQVQAQFSDYGRPHSIKRLARWLVDPEGHGMTYDVTANLTPVQAFTQRRGNCLSFTLMLVSMAEELGVQLRFNEVDLPDEWGFEEDKHLILYRHVNSLFRFAGGTHVFDLAMENYDKRYPQRLISSNKATAMFHNNLAVDALRAEDLPTAVHHLQMAIALEPAYSDLFVNLAVIFKRQQKMSLAEEALLHALELQSDSAIAASSLERLYRSLGKNRRADKYARLASRARLRNPYYQFQQAKAQFDEQQYSQARKSIRQAKKLHAKDDRFFDLSSKIEQQLGFYRKALQDLDQAHKLTTDTKDRERYVSRAMLVAQLIVERQQKREEQRRAAKQVEVMVGNQRFP